MADESKPSVKNLRAQFEQRAQLSQRKLVITPELFFKQQRETAEREAQNLLLARKKAAAFNLAMRQLELKQVAVEQPRTVAQEEERTKLRKEARRLSVALRNIDEVAEEKRPVLQQQERRATHLLLASMAEEFEQEMKKDELASIKEEEEARERAAAAAELAKQEEELERKRKDLELAHEMAEMARKQLEEDERIRKAQQEQAEREAEAERKRKEAELNLAQKEQERQKMAAIQERDRQVLTTYLRENYPEKLAEVDALLSQFAGNLDVLFEELGKNQKFKESIAEDADDEFEEEDEDEEMEGKRRANDKLRASEGAMTVHTYKDDESVSPQLSKPRNEKSFLKPGVDLRSVVTSFYQIYAASKLKDIDDILRHFENRESDLFKTLEVKYDVTFATDGTCVPNNGDRIGEPFMEAPNGIGMGNSAAGSGKFAVDVQARTLKDKLAKQGQSAETVQAVLSSGSGMM